MTTTTEIVAGTVSIEVGNRQHLHRARLLLTIKDAPDVERCPITFKLLEFLPDSDYSIDYTYDGTHYSERVRIQSGCMTVVR